MKLRSLVLASACLAATSGSAGTLRILNWDEYIDPAVLAAFEGETGIDVTYEEYVDAEVVEAFMVSGEADYDLVIVASEYFARLSATGAIRSVDLTRVSGQENLRADVMSRFQSIADAPTHALSYLWGTTGIGYDAAAVSERMPDAPTGSWKMVFDPDIASRFADCGISILDAPEEMISIALNYLGHDPASSDPDHLAEAEALFAGIAPYVSYFDNEQISRLATGEACLAVAWSGDVLGAVEQQSEGIDLRYSMPKEGAPIWFDMLVIPRTAPASDAAYRFLNFLLRPEIIAQITNHVWYPNPNEAAVQHVAPEVLSDPAVYPPAEVMDLLFLNPSRPGHDKRAIARGWRRLKVTH